MDKNNFRINFQKLGNFLSGMFMPNIGVFVAWGFLTAMFMPSGWFPNEKLASISQPMLTYLLPTLIGYTGGKLVYETRGAVVGVVATFGIITGSSIPMFLGAMIAGPFGGYTIKKFDGIIRPKIKPGFEMFVDNFSAGALSLGLSIFFFSLVGPLVEKLNSALETSVNFLVQLNLLPLTSILVEPAKVLFLNNAVNYGVFSPLGMQQVATFGKSIFFLIETNPGPGLGVLLAFLAFGKKMEKESSAGAIIIQLFGGIHEIYFPYILMKPILVLALIAGGITGVTTYTLLDGGLLAPASPGSIFSLIIMSPKNLIFVTLIGVLFSTAVSFLVASLLLKSAEELKESEIREEKEELSGRKTVICRGKVVHRIAVACDAGFGTSAMGASILKKKIKALNLDVEICNMAIRDLSEDLDIIITHKNLLDMAKSKVKTPIILSMHNFLNEKFYEDLAKSLALGNSDLPTYEKASSKEMLLKENIRLDLESIPKEEAIRLAGELLFESGYVEKSYIDSMLERERHLTTYVGNFLALPHGSIRGMENVLKTGIVVLQFPDGVDFGEGNVAKILIGISAKNNEHLDIISNIVDIVENASLVEDISRTDDIEEIYKLFSSI